MIECVYGAEAQSVPTGYAVGDYRDNLKHVLNIPPEAQARVNGVQVGEECLPGDGKTLEWIKKNGEKGLPWVTVTELVTAYKVPPKCAREVLENHARQDSSCCIEVRDPKQNQPRRLYDEDKVKGGIRQAKEAGRYKAPLCPLCRDVRLKVKATHPRFRYLKCDKCQYEDKEDRKT